MSSAGGGAGGQRITVDWAKPIPCEDRVAFVAVAAETNANGLTTFNSQQFIFDGRPVADMSMNLSWHSLLASLVLLFFFLATLPTPLVH